VCLRSVFAVQELCNTQQPLIGLDLPLPAEEGFRKGLVRNELRGGRRFTRVLLVCVGEAQCGSRGQHRKG
jgi:hypothetical protein